MTGVSAGPLRPASTAKTTMTNTDSNEQTTPPEAPARRPHLALVDPASGKAGSPTPSERQALYLAALRKGKLPRGQVAAWAKAWGLSTPTISEELAAARADLEASRQAPAAKAQAHELITQAAELADNVKRLAAQALKVAAEGDAGLQKAKGLEVGAKLLASAAGLKLKAAAELRQLHGLKPEAGGYGQAPGYQPITAAALHGFTSESLR